MSRPIICLPAEFRPNDDAEPASGLGSLSAWCPWCETLHWHGAAGRGAEPREESRGAHCEPGWGSPAAGHSYALGVNGTRPRGEDSRPAAPMVRKEHRLHSALRAHEIELRRALLLAILSGAVDACHFGSGNTAGATIADGELLTTAMGRDWQFITPSREYRGRGLPSLLAGLFAVTPGIAARRILETLAGIELSAAHALILEGVVDDWVRHSEVRR